MLVDNFGRRINYLRLSVTDRCNFRCRYCMPAGGVRKLDHDDVLSYEELLLAARAAVSLGIEKIRVTGGEPLVRKGLCAFLARLTAIPGLRQLVLTTNGLLLPEMARNLKKAGVQRLNISLDSLRPEIFSRITRGGNLRQVQAGIAAAAEAGFPLKLNMVVMRGENDGELEDFAALTLNHPFAVRFIEYMPAIKEKNWNKLVISGEEILDRLAKRFSFAPVERGELAGPAREFRIAGAAGSIGVITPLSGHFCGNCNRIRVTSSGMVRCCLFANAGFDLKPLLQSGDPAAVAAELHRIVGQKPARHALGLVEADHVPFAMSGIGG
jgi:cyclic pyranopterin phosphate synthase